MKLWEKGYSLNGEIEAFTVGNDYLLDRRLVRYDCIASMAHARMLGRMGILSAKESREIIAALGEIIELDSKGEFKISPGDEDCHTAIEGYLVDKLGDTGKKIHTARSRNDQVLTALRLYYKAEIKETVSLCKGFLSALSAFRKKNRKVPMPGYTHMRKAMPSSMGMWADAFSESMSDNIAMMEFLQDLVDQSPLGTGAGYGLPIKLDREMTRKLLGFRRLQKSPIYAQNSRGKFEASILHGLGQIMLDLNRLSSDIILFSMPEFGYFILPKEMTTGSSIMPHKSNPDVLELLRAKYHLLLSLESEVSGISGNLISGYNRDLQLTKEPVITGFDVAKESISVASLLLSKMKADKNRCEEGMSAELYSVQNAYSLVARGMPFRDAYKNVSLKFGKQAERTQ